jgi:hypothetical protein
VEEARPWSPGTSPEVIKEIEGRWAGLLAAYRDLEIVAVDRIENWTGRSGYEEEPESVADEIVALEWGRATKTFRAVDVLCRAGYGEQAAMLNRSLFEGMAVAHWAHGNPAETETRLTDAKRMNAHLAAKLVEEMDWEAEVNADAVTNSKLEGEELEELERKFGKHGERLWTGPGSLPKLLRAIEYQWDKAGRQQLWHFYEVVNRDNNQLLHSTVVGLSRVIGGNAEGSGSVKIGPSSEHIDKALFGAFWSYAQILTLMATRFEWEDQDGLEARINELMGRFRGV